MRICPSCSTENPDDRDFCSSCNTYLRWEPTQYSPSVPSVAQTPAAPAPPRAPDDAPTQADPPPAESEQSRHAMQRLPVIKPEGTRQQETAPSDGPAATAAPPPPPAPPPPEPPPTEPDTVIVTLRLPGEEGAGGASVATSVAPGTQAILLALVRNQSGIVDNYDLVIDGMPEAWWTITPSTVYLVPFGAPGGEYEQEVEVRLHPPRSPEAEARPWPVRIVATSKAHERPVGSASANVVIEPYQELETEMRPERANGHRKAKYAIAVRNRANAPTDVAFAAVDSERRLRRRRFRERVRVSVRRARAERAAGQATRHAVHRQAAEDTLVRTPDGTPLPGLGRPGRGRATVDPSAGRLPAQAVDSLVAADRGSDPGGDRNRDLAAVAA